MASPSAPLPIVAAPSGASSSSTPTKPRLIDFKEVVRRTGLGKTTVKKLIATDPTFPPTVKIGYLSRWEAAEVDNWIERAIAAAHERARMKHERGR